MAIHQSTTSLIKESMEEFLKAAEICIQHKKEDGGCLGYPGAAIMFSVADSIGSYHRHDANFKIIVDGKNKTITGASCNNYFIFNSKYYGLNLSEKNTEKKL